MDCPSFFQSLRVYPLNSIGTSLPCALYTPPPPYSLLADRTDVCNRLTSRTLIFLNRTLYRIGNLSACFSGAWSPWTFSVSLIRTPFYSPPPVCRNPLYLTTSRKFLFLVPSLLQNSSPLPCRLLFFCLAHLVPHVVDYFLIFPEYITEALCPLFSPHDVCRLLKRSRAMG